MLATAVAPNAECEILPAADYGIPLGIGSEPPLEVEGEIPLDVPGAAPPEEPLHVACNYTQKVWLPTFNNQHTPVAKHEWCLKSGVVRNQGGEQARPMGFFITVLGELQVTLEREWHKTHMVAKLPQSQMRLMLRELEAIEEFSDRWWRTESSQVRELVRIVRRVRSDISERTIVNTVTRMW